MFTMWRVHSHDKITQLRFDRCDAITEFVAAPVPGLSECPAELISIDAEIQEGLSLEAVGALRHSTESVCGAARQIEQRSVAVGCQV